MYYDQEEQLNAPLSTDTTDTQELPITSEEAPVGENQEAVEVSEESIPEEAVEEEYLNDDDDDFEETTKELDDDDDYEEVEAIEV